MADGKDRELSDKDLKKAAGGGQAYSTPPSKDRELSDKDLKNVAGGGQPYSTPSSKGGKGSLGTPSAGAGVDDAAGSDFGTPKDPYGDARPDKGKK